MRPRQDALLVIPLVLLVFCGRAYAYIDPGTGSLALQIALAALFAGLFALRSFWTKIRAFFTRVFHKDAPKQNPPDQPKAAPRP